jgi:hypothetical protein
MSKSKNKTGKAKATQTVKKGKMAFLAKGKNAPKPKKK